MYMLYLALSSTWCKLIVVIIMDIILMASTVFFYPDHNYRCLEKGQKKSEDRHLLGDFPEWEMWDSGTSCSLMTRELYVPAFSIPRL
jgi:hypothetical protein